MTDTPEKVSTDSSLSLKSSVSNDQPSSGPIKEDGGEVGVSPSSKDKASEAKVSENDHGMLMVHKLTVCSCYLTIR